MVDLKAMDAAGAYGKLLGQNQSAKVAGSGGEFQNALTDAISGTKNATSSAEAISMQQIAGKADLIDVVTAMNNAEMAVSSVVAVRDKVIQAYNDIIRMPM
jgi:flagellar hook-basal body complex protein FliE